jgi:hypothetical protein
VIENSAWFAKSVEVMEHNHQTLVCLVPAPERVEKESGYAYRFREQSIHQAVIQKLARIVTGVRSSHLLIASGYLQEASILQRTVDEAQEDTLFLVYGRITSRWTDLHDKYLQNFWHDSPFSKVAVRRPQIRDYIAETEAAMITEGKLVGVSPMKDIYALYSGYAHCSSSHTMELVRGSPPTWCLNGLPGTDFQKDQIYDVRNQHIRGLIAFACSALLFDNKALFDQTMIFKASFSAATESQVAAHS